MTTSVWKSSRTMTSKMIERLSGGSVREPGSQARRPGAVATFSTPAG